MKDIINKDGVRVKDITNLNVNLDSDEFIKINKICNNNGTIGFFNNQLH